MKYKSYQQAVNYIESLIPTGQKYKFPADLGVQRVRHLLGLLGNPQDSFKSIHIAGTSGKGSTAYLTSLILQKQGYKVGLHLSPHLQTIRERLLVNNQLIPEEDFTLLANEVEPFINKTSDAFESPVTYFEALLALVFVHFKKEKIEFGVIETGLGGTYDGTNVLNSLITVITRIGFDHMAILGNTITEIAAQKAGIIKSQNIACICQSQNDEAKQVISKTAQSLKVPLLTQGQEFSVISSKSLETGSVFTYKDQVTTITDIKLPLLGYHQIDNCACAIQTVLALGKIGFKIDVSKIKPAIAMAHFPGRLEYVVVHNQEWILDGAHNEDKLSATMNSLASLYPDKKKVAIIGFKQDKDLETCIKIIAPHFEVIICTQSKALTDMGRNLAAPSESIKDMLERVGFKGKIMVAQQVSDAIEKIESIHDQDILRVVTGSLYLVGEVRNKLGLEVIL